MRRADGLVQRRTAAQAGAATAAAAAREPDDDGDAQAAESAEAHPDSKDTRLTLMEEVLLLGLKDKEVRSMQSHHCLTSLHRDTLLFGMTAFRRVCAAAFWSSWRSGGG